MMKKRYLFGILLISLLFVSVVYASNILGDVNDDGILDINDALMIARSVINNDYNIETYDINHDGTVKMNDVMLLINNIFDNFHQNEISLNATRGTKYLNESKLTVTLVPTVNVGDNIDKTVSWQSSNTTVATVSSSGVVTAKSPGVTTISASVGDAIATYTFTVKKKIVIVIGASQVGKMCTNAATYSSDKYKYGPDISCLTTSQKNNLINNYNRTDLKGTDDETLAYIKLGSTGFEYQTGIDWKIGATGYDADEESGWSRTTSLMNKYASVKDYVEFYIYFPIAGNGVAKYSCSEIKTSNTEIANYIANYNTVIQQIKNSGFNFKAYVVSVQPVKVSQADADHSNIVVNNNANSCTAKYRSNRKYYEFNKVAKKLLKNYDDLTYVETFTKIMKVNEEGTNYSYKKTYNTVDGMHWTYDTTQDYVTWMLESNYDL